MLKAGINDGSTMDLGLDYFKICTVSNSTL